MSFRIKFGRGGRGTQQNSYIPPSATVHTTNNQVKDLTTNSSSISSTTTSLNSYDMFERKYQERPTNLINYVDNPSETMQTPQRGDKGDRGEKGEKGEKGDRGDSSPITKTIFYYNPFELVHNSEVEEHQKKTILRFPLNCVMWKPVTITIQGSFKNCLLKLYRSDPLSTTLLEQTLLETSNDVYEWDVSNMSLIGIQSLTLELENVGTETQKFYSVDITCVEK